MPAPADMTLLRQYIEGDESAFTTLFERHVHLVHSAASRQTRNPSHAEEITQAVFIVLARKAKSLSPKTVVSGWLYQAARLTTASLIKREIRRQRREQEVYMQTLTEPDTSLWEQILPLLDDAMGRLGEKERNAIVLRFFENKTPQEVAAALQLSEATARKRVSRALEKLRALFAKRGVVLTTVIIAGTISGNSVQAAPAALANSAMAITIAQGATVSGSTLTLVKGALKIMAWTKAQTAIVIGVAAILGAGTVATFEVQHQHARAQMEFPRSSWAAVGYADPVLAFETSLWAAVQGDGKTLLASCSPRMQGDTTAKVGRQMQALGKSLLPEELFAQVGAKFIEGVTGFRVLDKITSGNQVILHFQLEGTEQKHAVTMIKIGKEWKIDDIQ